MPSTLLGGAYGMQSRMELRHSQNMNKPWHAKHYGTHASKHDQKKQNTIPMHPQKKTRAMPYLANHRPCHDFVHAKIAKCRVEFTKYCTCHQKCISEYKRSHEMWQIRFIALTTPNIHAAKFIKIPRSENARILRDFLKNARSRFEQGHRSDHEQRVKTTRRNPLVRGG